MKPQKSFFRARAIVAVLCFSLCNQSKMRVFSQQDEKPESETFEMSILPDKNDPRSPWIVIAINENSSTTTTPGGTVTKESLKFGQPYYATDKKGDYIRIAKPGDLRNRPSEADAHDYGWIHKDDVLLENYALTDPKSFIPKRAVYINTIMADGLDDVSWDHEMIRFYKDPYLTIPVAFKPNLYDVFFEYGYSGDGKAILVGYDAFIDLNRLQDHSAGLIGWVDRKRLLEWDHRIVFEPNLDQSAILERNLKGIKTRITYPVVKKRPRCFLIRLLSKTKSTDPLIIWEESSHDETMVSGRKIGYWNRFPVLEKLNDNVYKVAVLGRVLGSDCSIHENTDAIVRQRLNDRISAMRQINVVFVIDGTVTMQPYYEAASKAIVNSMLAIEHKTPYLSLKFGAVVYRDEAERPYNRLVEVKDLSQNHRSLAQWLSKIKTEESGDDRDISEAVFYGLLEALGSVLYQSDEANIVILLGNAGNHQRNDASQVSKDLIAEMLAKKNVNLLAFQMSSRDHPAFKDYESQISELMQEAGNRIYKRNHQILGNYLLGERPFIKKIDAGTIKLENMPAMILQTPADEAHLPLDSLEGIFTKAVKEIINYNERIIGMAQDMIENGSSLDQFFIQDDGKYTGSYASGLNNLFASLNIQNDLLGCYYSNNVRIAKKGYLSMNHDSLEHPVFKPALFIEQHELSMIHDYLRRFNRSRSLNDSRWNLYEMGRVVIKAHLGFELERFFKEQSRDFVDNIIIGIPFRSNLLKSVKLIDILDTSAFYDEDLLRITRQADKFEGISNILSNWRSHPYSFISNDKIFHWIDFEVLP